MQLLKASKSLLVSLFVSSAFAVMQRTGRGYQRGVTNRHSGTGDDVRRDKEQYRGLKLGKHFRSYKHRYGKYSMAFRSTRHASA